MQQRLPAPRSYICSIKNHAFLGEKVIFKLHTEYDTNIVLWFPCRTEEAYAILDHDLKQSHYWRVYYLPDTDKITRMESLSGCTIL